MFGGSKYLLRRRLLYHPNFRKVQRWRMNFCFHPFTNLKRTPSSFWGLLLTYSETIKKKQHETSPRIKLKKVSKYRLYMGVSKNRVLPGTRLTHSKAIKGAVGIRDSKKGWTPAANFRTPNFGPWPCNKKSWKNLCLFPRKSKDQTLPIGSRESFAWIILKTILCLVLDSQGFGCFQKYGKTPQIIHLNRVFHYFHHPFWGFSPYFWKHPYSLPSISGT